jgi:hypothetical protein
MLCCAAMSSYISSTNNPCFSSSSIRACSRTHGQLFLGFRGATAPQIHALPWGSSLEYVSIFRKCCRSRLEMGRAGPMEWTSQTMQGSIATISKTRMQNSSTKWSRPLKSQSASLHLFITFSQATLLYTPFDLFVGLDTQSDLRLCRL